MCHTIVFQWSYGIVLWEVFSGGCKPYPAVKDRDLERYIVDDRKRLAKPSRLEGYADDM